MILNYLRRHGRASRAELVEATALSRATISSLTGDLLTRGHVVTADSASTATQVGRPPEKLALNPAAGLVLGIDFGHARVNLVAADAAHEVVGSRSRPYPRGTGWLGRCAIALSAARELLAASGAPGALVAVGVGVPGAIAHRADVVEAVLSAIRTELAAPAHCDNNARLAGLAETVWGAARGLSDVAYIKLSNGVGGALVLGGRIHSGPGDLAGEFGHVCVDPTGPVCRCTNHGCLECYVRVDQVLADAGLKTVADIRAALDHADPHAADVIRTAGRRIGTVLAAVGTVTDVTHVVLGGELADLGEHLFQPVRRTLQIQYGGGRTDDIRVEPATLGDYAGALGGIAQVLHDSSVPILPPPLSANLTATLDR